MRFFIILIFSLQTILFSACTPAASLTGRQQHTKKETLDKQLQVLTDKIVLSLSQTKKSNIAVIEFSNLDGKITKLGKYIAEELITRLYLTQEFNVIERQLLNKVIQEHKLNLSGLIDVNSAQELGRLLGVDAIASGSVTDLGKSIKVNARLISTQTGQIFSVASVNIIKDDVVNNLMASVPAQEIEVATISPETLPDTRVLNKNLPTVMQDDFVFELNGCRIENRKIYCSLTVTNTTENDRDLRTEIKKTKLFDETGNEYPLTIIKISNSASQKHWYHINKLLVAGIPTPVELVFENVSSSTSLISLLSIDFGKQTGVIKFRNIMLD